MALRVGITGGIGSGKTTVCRIFELLGVPVYYADDRAKWLMNNDPILRDGLLQQFGEEAYLPDGGLNRAHIASIVFNDKSQLETLNSLVHPAVRRDGEDWAAAQIAPYTLREAALLFESGIYQTLDQLITVTAPESVRIARVVARDNTSEEAVRARMANQWPEEKKVALSDFIIQNDGQHGLLEQVWKLHHQLLLLSQETRNL